MAKSISQIALADKIDALEKVLDDAPYFLKTTEKRRKLAKWLDEGSFLLGSLLTEQTVNNSHIQPPSKLIVT